MNLNRDFSDLFSALNAEGVRYLLVGGYAFSFHAVPRYTKDLDVWVEATPEMAPRTLRALLAFGAPAELIEESDFATPAITAQCIRVPVSDGHMAAVFVAFEKKPSREEILAAWLSFSGKPQALKLPSAPNPFLNYFEDDTRPQTIEAIEAVEACVPLVGRCPVTRG